LARQFTYLRLKVDNKLSRIIRRPHRINPPNNLALLRAAAPLPFSEKMKQPTGIFSVGKVRGE